MTLIARSDEFSILFMYQLLCPNLPPNKRIVRLIGSYFSWHPHAIINGRLSFLVLIFFRGQCSAIYLLVLPATDHISDEENKLDAKHHGGISRV